MVTRRILKYIIIALIPLITIALYTMAPMYSNTIHTTSISYDKKTSANIHLKYKVTLLHNGKIVEDPFYIENLDALVVKMLCPSCTIYGTAPDLTQVEVPAMFGNLTLHIKCIPPVGSSLSPYDVNLEPDNVTLHISDTAFNISIIFSYYAPENYTCRTEGLLWANILLMDDTMIYLSNGPNTIQYIISIGRTYDISGATIELEEDFAYMYTFMLTGYGFKDYYPSDPNVIAYCFLVQDYILNATNLVETESRTSTAKVAYYYNASTGFELAIYGGIDTIGMSGVKFIYLIGNTLTCNVTWPSGVGSVGAPQPGINDITVKAPLMKATLESTIANPPNVYAAFVLSRENQPP